LPASKYQVSMCKRHLIEGICLKNQKSVNGLKQGSPM